MRYVVYWLGIIAYGAVLVGSLWSIAPATLGLVVTSFAVMIGFAGWHCAKHGPTLRGFLRCADRCGGRGTVQPCAEP